MFKDFGKRLRQEVKRHVDQRLKKSEAISGQKVMYPRAMRTNHLLMSAV